MNILGIEVTNMIVMKKIIITLKTFRDVEQYVVAAVTA